MNHEVLNRVKQFTPYKVFEDSPWHAINVLEDNIMFDHPDKIKNGISNTPIELKDKNEEKSFIQKLLHKVNEKTLSQAG